jgi:hypothetical protein
LSVVKQQLQGFLAETQTDELITASSMYALEDRLKSTRLFGELMTELNEGR